MFVPGREGDVSTNDQQSLPLEVFSPGTPISNPETHLSIPKQCGFQAKQCGFQTVFCMSFRCGCAAAARHCWPYLARTGAVLLGYSCTRLRILLCAMLLYVTADILVRDCGYSCTRSGAGRCRASRCATTTTDATPSRAAPRSSRRVSQPPRREIKCLCTATRSDAGMHTHVRFICCTAFETH